MCRLRYFGSDEWSFALYTYSYDRYELAIFPGGSFFGRPEDAFISAANLYLSDKND
jgi:hypothetical protein